MVIHVVAPGDTLWAIASRYGVAYGSDRFSNAIADPNVLVVGGARHTAAGRTACAAALCREAR